MIVTTICVLLGMLAMSIPIAAVLGMLGLVLDKVYSFLPLWRAVGENAWVSNIDVILVAVPLFILLGEILLRSGIAEKMYAAATHWLSWLPGGLMHSNISSCAMFAAVSGSSVATAATIGTVAIEQIHKRGYNERFFLGTIAAGGTIGILIPPSINMIVYGVLTQCSIVQLYLAGFTPGFMLAGLFMLTIAIVCMFKPKWGGQKIETNWKNRFSSLPDLLPPVLLFIVIIGSIYVGIATPTESAALGVIAALILVAFHKRLSITMLREAFEGTMRSTGMIMAILVAAFFLNFVLTGIGLTHKVNALITGLGWTPMQTLIAVIAFYVVLGMFMETLSMMVATVPIITPVIVSLGFDPVWFGVIIILLIETAMITPPVGINLFVVQGVRGRGAITDVMIGSSPFVVTLIIMIVLLVMFPNIAMWLPNTVAR